MAVASWGDFLYPGTTVLKNKKDYKNQADLDNFERGATSIRIEELKSNPINGDFNLAHMQSIHQQVFKDVYEWAGQTRPFNIAKPTTGGGQVKFTDFNEIKNKADVIQNDIKAADYLRGTNKAEFSDKIGDIYKEVNDLHPFREGNGRTARVFMEQLANGAGYELNYSGVTKQEWNSAAKAAALGNTDPIKWVFNEISAPQRAVAFDKLNIQTALGRHPELDGAYRALYDAKQSGKDVALTKETISKELHSGKVFDGKANTADSLKAIDLAAKERGLTVTEPGRIGSKHSGTVAAQSSHHVLFKVDDKNAVRFEKKTLDPNLTLKVGDKLILQHQELKPDKTREVSGAQGMERVSTSR
jgi:cell filamentation protein